MHRGARADEPTRRLTHVFFDAEGTLWVPREGQSFDGFWADPDPARADTVFMPTPGIHETLGALLDRGLRLVVVSKHDVHLLPHLLDRFRLRGFFDDVLVNGHKGARIVQWLNDHGLGPQNGLMVGDRVDLDIDPARSFGVPAVLLDRPGNRGADAPRIHDLRDLVALAEILRWDPQPRDPAHGRATEGGTWTGLAPLRKSS